MFLLYFRGLVSATFHGWGNALCVVVSTDDLHIACPIKNAIQKFELNWTYTGSSNSQGHGNSKFNTLSLILYSEHRPSLFYIQMCQTKSQEITRDPRRSRNTLLWCSLGELDSGDSTFTRATLLEFKLESEFNLICQTVTGQDFKIKKIALFGCGIKWQISAGTSWIDVRLLKCSAMKVEDQGRKCITKWASSKVY